MKWFVYPLKKYRDVASGRVLTVQLDPPSDASEGRCHKAAVTQQLVSYRGTYYDMP
jgi:hypothetical protein